MADATDDRHGVPNDGPHDRFVVERPEILERAAAAGEDRHRRPGGVRGRDVPPEPIERTGDACGGGLALDLARDEHDTDERPAPREHVSDVVPDRTRRARDDPDEGRSGGQRSFSFDAEEAFLRESRLELLEPDREVAEARGLERLHVQLKGAGRLIDVHPTVDHDAEAGPGLEGRGQPLVAEPDALELVALVAQAEVGMAGRRHRHPPDLSFDPQVAQPLVRADHAADRAGDVGDRQDPQSERARRRRRSSDRLWVHGRAIPGRSRSRRSPGGRVEGIPCRKHPVGRLGPLAPIAPIAHRRRCSGIRPGSGTRRSGYRPGSCRLRRRTGGPGPRDRSRASRPCGRPERCRRRSQARSRRPRGRR